MGQASDWELATAEYSKTRNHQSDLCDENGCGESVVEYMLGQYKSPLIVKGSSHVVVTLIVTFLVILFGLLSFAYMNAATLRLGY